MITRSTHRSTRFVRLDHLGKVLLIWLLPKNLQCVKRSQLTSSVIDSNDNYMVLKSFRSDHSGRVPKILLELKYLQLIMSYHLDDAEAQRKRYVLRHGVRRHNYLHDRQFRQIWPFRKSAVYLVAIKVAATNPLVCSHLLSLWLSSNKALPTTLTSSSDP